MTGTPRRRWDWRNAALALLVPALFFAALEGLLALLGVAPVRYPDDPHVGFTGSLPLFTEERAADGTAFLATAANKRRLFNVQRFPRDKAPASYRIFCVGGSTTYGRPYDDSTSFCGWLRELLPRVDPGRRWEVVNAGGVSYASYRVALLMEELALYEPDLFIVYSGHNEFLERRTYRGLIATPPALRGVAAMASRTRLWAVLRQGLHALRPGGPEPDAAAPPATALAAEVTTLLDASVGPEAYERDDAWRRQVVDHYAFNLARMAEIARSAGAATILVTPAANLRHSAPFKSVSRADLTGEEAAQWQRRQDAARAALAGGDAEAAVAALDGALAIDDRHAGTHYLLGGALDALERFADARRAYGRARDEDVCPLRAPAEIIAAARRVAAERGLPTVDFAAAVDAAAPQGIPGREQFLDHVHPTLDTHRGLALDLLGALRDAGVLRPSATWGPELVAAATARVEGRIDPTAHAQALINLSKVLGWAGKLEEASALALEAAERGPELAEAHYQAGLTAQLLGRADEAIEHYQRALRLAPRAATAHGNLAAAYEAQGRTLLAIRHYRQAIALVGPAESAYRRQLEATLERLGATPR